MTFPMAGWRSAGRDCPCLTLSSTSCRRGHHREQASRRGAGLDQAAAAAQNLDVELRQSTAELGHAVSAGGIFPRYPKDRMLVGIERNRLAMVLQIALQSLEIGKRALGRDKAKLHQSAGGVIDENQKRAGRRPIFEPAMVRTVDLN